MAVKHRWVMMSLAAVVLTTSCSSDTSTTTTPAPAPTSLDTSAITPPRGSNSLELPTEIRGEFTAVTVTFTDGRSFKVEYPTEWGLSRHSWVPATELILELEEPRDNGQGYLWASATFTHSNDGWIPTIRYRPEWTEEEISFAEAAMELEQQDNGFVVLHTTAPLRHMSTDPDQAPTYGDAIDSPSMNVGGVIELQPDCDPATFETDTTETYVTWCDEDSDVAVVVFTEPRHHEAVMANLDIELIEE